MKVSVFKLKELQSVRYCRVPENKLPNPLVINMGGTNSYMTAAHSVFSTAVDMASILGADPSQVGVLSLDLVPPASLVSPTRPHLARSLPHGSDPLGMRATRRKRRGQGVPSRNPVIGNSRGRGRRRELTKQTQKSRYFNLVVKREAVSQPTDSFANWLED